MTFSSIPNTNHFNPEIRARLRELMMEKYIHTPQNAELWCLLEDLMYQVSSTSPKPKVMGSLVIGSPHSGKTTGIRQFIKAYFENVPDANENDIFYFEIPIRAHLKGLMTEMAISLKIPDVSVSSFHSYPTYVLVDKVATKLRRNETKLVILDEFQNLFYLTGENRAEILNGFNDLTNKSHIPIVLVGLEGIDEILDVESYFPSRINLKGTFGSRFMEFHFTPWKDPHDPIFVSFLKTVVENSALHCEKKNHFYIHDEAREWLMEMTGGLTGKLIHIIKWAARDMIRQNLPEEISFNTLKHALNQLKINGW